MNFMSGVFSTKILLFTNYGLCDKYVSFFYTFGVILTTEGNKTVFSPGPKRVAPFKDESSSTEA